MEEFRVRKPPKFPDQMTELDCRACHATGGISVPSGCFGSKTFMCGECRGKGTFTEGELIFKKATKALEEQAVNASAQRDVVIAALREWANGDPSVEATAETQLRMELSKLDVIEKTVHPDVQKWMELQKREKEKKDGDGREASR